MKRIIISTLAVLCAIGAYADDKQIVTSQKYLKDELDLKLDKLEGLGANKMLMYTTTSDTTHQIGTPRDIVNTLGTKTNGVYTDTTSNAVVERSAVKGGIDAKQDNITGKTEGYVAIYTSTPGELSEKGIYNGGTIKGSDTLVTAKTANDAIVNAVNSELTQVDATTGQPSNNGTLWRVSTGLTLLDTAAAASGGYDMSLLTTPGSYMCYKSLDAEDMSQSSCDSTTYNNLSYGDWAIPFTVNNETVYVTGTSACSSVSGEYATVSPNQSTIDGEYDTQHEAAPTSSPAGGECHCKVTGVDGNNVVSRWVFFDSYSSSVCAVGCAYACGRSVRISSGFRSGVFGAVQ